MARRRSSNAAGSPMLFVDPFRRQHVRLFLPRLLEQEAEKPAYAGSHADAARKILLHWADLADAGHFNQKKETSLDAEFLEKIFGDALGYRSVSESPNDYHREKNPTVAGAGTADGALGSFRSGQCVCPTAIIELKGPNTDLDHDKFNGRTPVQQCLDYLNALPDCPWGIVSNCVTIRLYHRNRTPRAYEEFTVADFRDEKRFKQFYYIFERGGLLDGKLLRARAPELLKQTQERQREVGDELYNDYSKHRIELIHHLVKERGQPEDQAIHIAQRILDRIIFIAFCEDRALLPEGIISRAYKELPPFPKVVNPRWQNFKGLFEAVDKGDENYGIPAYNGGLFHDDPAIDNLELDDKWTHFFHSVSRYDFRDEVNVDVLGHLFERSVTELEKLRVVGLFGAQAGGDGQPAMPKSAQRKRFGIYYTPPAFTQLIVENTVGRLIADRVESLGDPMLRVEALRKLKICDPACGSGAFLIAGYERLEDAYHEAARLLRIEGRRDEADAVEAGCPDWILADNLFGMDLSEESVEISQLALWIRSARKGRRLSDLSANIKAGNSLIIDPAVHSRAQVWRETFPEIFSGPEGGFDAVIGNPPWERLKLQEREFFALGAPEIAGAVNAADRRKLIAVLERERPELWKRYGAAKAVAEATLAHVRASGEFPLTARGDINTYMLFAELARKIVAPSGRVGLLVPSGIATDDTTKNFFGDLIASRCLSALYDFENRKLIFPDVDGRFKFSVLLMGGSQVKEAATDFVFFAHAIEDLRDQGRHIELTAKDLALMNPNTRTCPVFRSRRDADLTRRVYRNVPILIDENRREGGNLWGIRFLRMFDQTNDAEHFKTGEELKDDGFKLAGNRWTKRKMVYLPLYEAKMVQAFDHRAASIVIEANNWFRQGQKEETSPVKHQNPEFVITPRYWAAEDVIQERLPSPAPPSLLAFKNVTSPTNQRTMIASFIPTTGVINSAPLILFGAGFPVRLQSCLLANLNALALDYVARQKIGNVNLNFFLIEQFPMLPPDRYDEKCLWDKKRTLEAWISERVLKLTCTADDMRPLAEAARFKSGVYRWRENERAQLRAELDAAYFLLYGLSREDVEYILTTFQGIAKEEDEAHFGTGPMRRLILDAYRDLKAADR